MGGPEKVVFLYFCTESSLLGRTKKKREQWWFQLTGCCLTRRKSIDQSIIQENSDLNSECIIYACNPVSSID